MISKYIVNSFICGRRLLDRAYMYFPIFSEDREREKERGGIQEDSRWNCKPTDSLGNRGSN